MKARKRRKTLLIISIIVAALALLTRATFLNWLEKNADHLGDNDKGNSGYVADGSNTGKDNDKNGNKDGDNKDQNNQNSGQNQPPVVEDKIQEVQLPDGKKVKIVYNEENGNKLIKNAITDDNSLQSFNIAPSGNKVVLLTTAQDMFTADLNGAVNNITKNQYNTSGGTVIEKNAYLNKKPEFLWHSSPKFLNDNTIVYITQIPWFKSTKYVYKVDLNNPTHTKLQGIQGENIAFDILDGTGLKVNVDGADKYIKGDGSGIQ